MAENLIIVGETKEEKFKSILPQIKSLIESEDDLIANMANVCAAIKHAFDFLWVGFYLVKNNELVLGPFQGPIACTRIALGKGVCGTSWKKREVIIVDDVDSFPGHISCSSLSKSEIVIPLFNKQNAVCAVLDIDSETYKTFNGVDAFYLREITKLLVV